MYNGDRDLTSVMAHGESADVYKRQQQLPEREAARAG
jgi:hypothetical protein